MEIFKLLNFKQIKLEKLERIARQEKRALARTLDIASNVPQEQQEYLRGLDALANYAKANSLTLHFNRNVDLFSDTKMNITKFDEDFEHATFSPELGLLSSYRNVDIGQSHLDLSKISDPVEKEKIATEIKETVTGMHTNWQKKDSPVQLAAMMEKIKDGVNNMVGFECIQ